MKSKSVTETVVDKPPTLAQAVSEAQAQTFRLWNRKGDRVYIPGNSCLQLGETHKFSRRTTRTGKQYDFCGKCGSCKMVKGLCSIKKAVGRE